MKVEPPIIGPAVQERVLEMNRHAQQLANKYGHPYAVVVLPRHPDEWDVSFRQADHELGKGEQIITVLRPEKASGNPLISGTPASTIEASAKLGQQAQELANIHGCKHSLVMADHNGKKVMHIRPSKQILKNETVIAVFSPESQPDSEPEPEPESEEIPDLHPDDFDRWMQVAELVWSLARKNGVRLESVEPNIRPYPGRPILRSYGKGSRLRISIRYIGMPNDGGQWYDAPISWDVLVPNIVRGLSSLLFDMPVAATERFKKDATRKAWHWLVISDIVPAAEAVDAIKAALTV